MDQSPFLHLGSAWYPELGDEASIAEDLARMAELGFNAVRVGDFAWSCFEPEAGRYETGWMLRILDRLHRAGIGAIMCTPTASVPAWMLATHPGIGFVDRDGRRFGAGGRQAADYCNPDFQRLSRGVTEAVAQAFGRHPAVIGWQVDNELGGHQKVSVSPAALAGWAAWLERRYGTIAELNHAWGTDVWSNRYHAFAQVPGPVPLPTYCHNHSLHTEYRRYMNDVAIAFQRQQVEIIRRHSAAPITHNSEDSLDEWDLTRDLDLAAHDCYSRYMPLPSMIHRMDCMRSLKPGRRFWVMETDAEGTIDGQLFPAGWTANVAMLAYASGAEGVSYWPWRNLRTGAEICGHDGLLYACGRPTTGFEPAKGVSELRRRLDRTLRRFAPAPAPVACIRSERNGHFNYIERIAGLRPNFDYRASLEAHHHDVAGLGAWRDVLYDQAELTGQRVVMSPYLPYTSPDFLARMRAHLDAGGTWVVGPYTGYLTAHHTNHATALLGELEAMLGIETRCFVPITSMPLVMADGLETEALMHAMAFIPRPGDEPLGAYGGDRLSGWCWGIRRQVGRGSVYVLGSEIGAAARRALFRSILIRAGVPLHPMPDRVIRVPQQDDQGRSAWALINTNHTPVRIDLPAAGCDDLTGARVGRQLDLAGNANAFVVFDQPIAG